ncbi:MAG: DNA cytosine methyltransferase [Bacteroidales bacterium]|nr:DNA cytosine methyltransferase [Bacteroidales bacterium]
MISNFGSLCSGIEAASYVFSQLGVQALWFSEIAEFPSKFLSLKYPNVPNVGDMMEIPSKIENGEIIAPDMICGGTPCQAFSFAGWKNGLNDDRGQLTLKFIDILNKSDEVRKKNSQKETIFLWENVEGVLSDKTNAFGCFLAGLAGLDNPISARKWTNGGILHGKTRNIAWRILDSKYFGVPQQRKRIYVMGGGTDFYPEKILFEQCEIFDDPYKPKIASLFDNPSDSVPLTKIINGHHFEVFRSYSDCVYTAYGTKWNGNAASFNGSLFVAQNGRVRRLSPLECERLMGFSDNYTLIDKCSMTQRYQAIGNSWAVPVIVWIFNRILQYKDLSEVSLEDVLHINVENCQLFLLSDFTHIVGGGKYINASTRIKSYSITSMLDIVDEKADDKLYLSPLACHGILRRKKERNVKINQRLSELLQICANSLNEG